jgi:hypothetical protein
MRHAPTRLQTVYYSILLCTNNLLHNVVRAVRHRYAAGLRRRALAAEAARSADEAAAVARALNLAQLRCTLWLATPQGKAAVQQELVVQGAAAARAQGAWEALPTKRERALAERCWRAQREFACCDVQSIGSIAVSELHTVLTAAGVLLSASALAAAAVQVCSYSSSSASGSGQFTAAQLHMWLQQQQQQEGSHTVAPASSSVTTATATAAATSRSKKLAAAVQQSAAAVKHKLAQALTSSGAAAQRRAETALLTRHFATSAATSARTLFRVTRPPKFSCLACPAAFALYSDALNHYSCCHCCSNNSNSASTSFAVTAASTGADAAGAAAVTTDSIAVVLPVLSVGSSTAQRAVLVAPHIAAAARQLPQALRAAAQWRRHAAEVLAVTTASAQADASECVRLQSKGVGGGAIELKLLARGIVGGLLQQLKAVGSGKCCYCL